MMKWYSESLFYYQKIELLNLKYFKNGKHYCC